MSAKRAFAVVKKYATANLPLPKRQTAFSAGYDLAAAETMTVPPGEIALVPTAFKAYIPPGEVLKIYARSSLAVKKHLMLPNSVGVIYALYHRVFQRAVGVIDADYVDNEQNEGQIFVALYNFGKESARIEKGERIAQGIFEKFYAVDGDEVGNGTPREGGFGSTGEQ